MLISASALRVREGDIIYVAGYRCRASRVTLHPGESPEELPVARYTLNSAPSESHRSNLPGNYEGMRSGGNKYRIVTFERDELRVGDLVHSDNDREKLPLEIVATEPEGFYVVKSLRTSHEFRLHSSQISPM